jgi:hypothetical protein
VVSLIVSLVKSETVSCPGLGAEIGLGLGVGLGVRVGIEQQGVEGDSAVRESVFEAVMAFMQTFSSLLMLPLNQSFATDSNPTGGVSEGCSRMSFRRVQLCRCSASLLCAATQVRVRARVSVRVYG